VVYRAWKKKAKDAGGGREGERYRMWEREERGVGGGNDGRGIIHVYTANILVPSRIE
jgi:hypothetical protein